MRPFFQALIAEFGKPGAVFSMNQQAVDGEYAYILWTAETADNVYEMATDACGRARLSPSQSPARLRPRASFSARQPNHQPLFQLSSGHSQPRNAYLFANGRVALRPSGVYCFESESAGESLPVLRLF